MASTVKREISLPDEITPGKKPRLNYGSHSPIGSTLVPITNHRVVLNPADCDLGFNIEGNGLKGSALYEHGFAYCWSGARATIGITGGKYCFSCKIVSGQPVEIDDTPFDQKHLCRVGISRGDDNVGNLGETNHSFGFGGTGKFSNSGKFSAYGERFDIGDTILCAVDLESKPMASISFSKNRKWLGTARQFNAGPSGLGVTNSPIKELHWESAVFPHVLLKNVVVELQFSYEDGLVPQNGYRPWALAMSDGNGLMGPSFSDVSNCELIMMVGLPASGKTTWAERWVNDHPEKRYILLGTNLALDQMKVPGLLRKQNYGERFDRLMDRATAIFNTLLTRASKTPRNFIIDQTNVYKSARKRKLKPFANYQKIAVVVFPRPEDLKFRSEKRFKEMGKEVPAKAVNEMLANFVLPKSKDMPGTDEYFDQVIYVELNMPESKKCLDEMKAKLQSGEHSQGSYPSQTIHPPDHGRDTRNQRFLPRDDFNHRRSYSGYEHRAAAPMLNSDFHQRNSAYGARVDYYHTPGAESMDLSPRFNPIVIHHPPMDLSPRYNRNVNHHPAPVHRSLSLYEAYGGTPKAPEVHMRSSTQSRFLPATSTPHSSTYGSMDAMNPYGNHTRNPPHFDGSGSHPRYH